MSSVIFFSILILLTIGIWMVVVISLWYGRELLRRQRALIKVLLPYIQKMERDRATMKALHIDKDEPISKYQDVTLPDEVHIAFTGEEK